MTGPENYLAAEALLTKLRQARTALGHRMNTAKAAAVMAEAQVHATLALAAATAMQATVDECVVGMTIEEHDAWYDVAGTKPTNGGASDD